MHLTHFTAPTDTDHTGLPCPAVIVAQLGGGKAAAAGSAAPGEGEPVRAGKCMGSWQALRGFVDMGGQQGDEEREGMRGGRRGRPTAYDFTIPHA